ncbi:adhesion G protein-coupled receptor L3-like isoform X2 [Limulus polyphemus]|uniref:Adhesion G protein-coupled receptor L3-like isoform X2 n=1 Tax=Limulus polyphemus TaxID=6850 RepID=A0ABM1S8R8_LIMPO|nr:adhesion G protein-coupled receptor L3-like isoform X2 [Limulus polyphemus]
MDFSLLLFVLFFIATCSARRGSKPAQYRTAYACEGRDLNITCNPGYHILLIRANYGRFSIALCNENGALNWSVDCRSKNSFSVMQSSCGMKNSCGLPASSLVFGDPCPGTLKYLEAQYQCVPDVSTTTTRRPRPQIIFPTIRSPVIKSTTELLKFLTKTSLTTTQTSSSTAITVMTTTTTVSSLLEPNSANPIQVFSSDEPSIISSSKNATDKYCPPVSSRGLFWNWTRIGQVMEQKCPDGAHGKATWTCSTSTNYWYPLTPNFRNCSSLWFGNFVERMHAVSKHESVVNVAEDLSRRTTKRRLYGKDIKEASFVMKGLVSATKNQPHYYSQNQKKELMQSLVKVSSNLLDRKQIESWEDLSPSKRRFSASTLLESLEDNALSLAKAQIAGDEFTHAEENVLASVKVIKAEGSSEVMFPQARDIMNTTWRGIENVVYIPGAVIQHFARFSEGYVSVIFMAYNNMENILQSHLLFPQHGPSQGQQEVSSEKIEQVVNSHVVSVSIGNTQFTHLPEPIILTFLNLQKENVTDPRCVFWDFETSDWSSQGCGVVSFNLSHTVCSCNHLTHFAVLMTIKAVELPIENSRALLVITYVGCSVSIISLVLAVITFQCFRSLQNDRTTIHKNLCLCLLVAEVLFVAGINQTSVPVLCGIVAGLLHYFFLAAFVWMFLEGFQLYLMLVEVFESEKSRVTWFYLLGYGVPAVIVFTSAAVDSHSYGTDQYCWLKADNYFIFSFIGPVIVILLANMVFLSIAVFVMCRHGNLKTAIKAKEQARLTKLSDPEDPSLHKVLITLWIRGATTLVVLLGLTWTFGLLYLNKESVIVAYIFTILNSLQGLFIFLFHCVRNKKVQKEYQKLIHQSDWLPDCLCKQKTQEQQSSIVTSSTTQPACSHSSPPHSWIITLGHDTPLVSSSLLNTTEDPATSRKINQNRRSSQNSSVSSQNLTSKSHLRNSLGNCIFNENLSEQDGRQTITRLHRPLAAGSVIENPMKAYDLYRLYKEQGVIHRSDMNQRMNPFLDHIYESIDTDQESLSSSYKCYQPSVSCNQMSPDGQYRYNYSPSHQSTSSIVCDQRPLLPAHLTNSPANLGHIPSDCQHSMPHCYPDETSYPKPGPLDSDISSVSSLDMKGNSSSSTLPAHSTTPSSEFSDGQLTSLSYHRQQRFLPAVTQNLYPQNEVLTINTTNYPSFNTVSVDPIKCYGTNVMNSDCYLGNKFMAKGQNSYPSDFTVADYSKGDRSDNCLALDQNNHSSDNAVVMAVLDGERVVCKLQPEDFKWSKHEPTLT